MIQPIDLGRGWNWFRRLSLDRIDIQSIDRSIKKPKPGVPTRALTSSWAGTDSARRSAESLVAQMPSQGPPRRRPRPLFLRPCHTYGAMHSSSRARPVDRPMDWTRDAWFGVRSCVGRSIDRPAKKPKSCVADNACISAIAAFACCLSHSSLTRTPIHDTTRCTYSAAPPRRRSERYRNGEPAAAGAASAAAAAGAGPGAGADGRAAGRRRSRGEWQRRR